MDVVIIDADGDSKFDRRASHFQSRKAKTAATINGIRQQRKAKLLHIELPPHLIYRKTHILLKDKIKQNNILNSILEKINYSRIIVNNIHDLNKNLRTFMASKRLDSQLSLNYFIGGSVAWNKLFKQHYDNNILSNYEKSAIHISSYDVFYFINFKDNRDIFNTYFRNTIEIIKASLEASIKTELPDFKIKIKSNEKLRDLTADDKVDYDTDAGFDIASSNTEKYTIFPSDRFEIILEYDDKPVAATSRKPATPRKTSVKAPPPPAASGTRKSTRSRKGGAGPKTKTIFSIDLCFNKKERIDTNPVLNINNLITVDRNDNLNYLNLYGIYILLELFKKNTFLQQKGYNQFKIRESIFENHILKPNVKSNILFNIAMLYYLTFSNTYLFNKNIFKILLYTYIKSINNIEKFIDSTEAKIIECLRPYINKCISNINSRLHSLDNNLGIFIVGGDATRRYKNNISITKDIDTKVYVPHNLKDNKDHIFSLINDELFKLCSFFIHNKNELFTSLNSKLNNIVDDDEYTYNAKFTLIDEDPNLLNFRFRQIFKHTYPVDLFSLDYRCKIDFTIIHKPTGKIREFTFKYDIAFLDITVEFLDTNDSYYDKYSILSNGLPISQLAFLLDDLNKTYNSDTSSLLRFTRNKINKDYDRYIELNKIVYGDKFEYETKSGKDILINKPNNSRNPDTISRMKLDQQRDYVAFDDLYNKFKLCYDKYLKLDKERKPKPKYKIPFSYNMDVLFSVFPLHEPSSARKGGMKSIDDSFSRLSISSMNDTCEYINNNEADELINYLTPEYSQIYIDNYDNQLIVLLNKEPNDIVQQLIEAAKGNNKITIIENDD